MVRSLTRPGPAAAAALALVWALAVLTLLIAPVFAGSPFPKRGLGYNDDISITGFGGGEVFWQYNWDSDTAYPQSYTEYTPMLWSDSPDHTGIGTRTLQNGWERANSQQSISWASTRLTTQSRPT